MRLLLTFFFLVSGLTVHPQVGKLIAKIDTSAIFITVDNLDNTYLITSKNELLKYNPTGKLLWSYSNKTSGKLAYADASDPMRILLFYPGLQQIIVLNNNLNEVSKYAFRDVAKQVTLVSSASTNGYWYYDQANFQLHKLSNDFTDVQQSGNIYQQTGKLLQPDMIQANAQNVYLHDVKLGFLQFDRFGAYLKTILADSPPNFQIKENFLWFVKNGSLTRLDTQTYETSQLTIPIPSPIEQAAIGNKIVAVMSARSVYLYTITAAAK